LKNSNVLDNHTARRTVLATCAAALAAACALSVPAPARANQITPPPMPSKLQVQAGNKPFLEGHGVGTQNYVCRPSGSGVAYVLVTPQATLFDDDDKEVTTHFFSPNPFEPNATPGVIAPGGTIRATWQHSPDTSSVWAKADQSSTDPAFVAPGAVAWLLLERVGSEDGPTGGDTLTPTTFIQRVNTAGGVAPSTGCNSPEDVGNEAFMPYTADYIFYRKSNNDE